MQDKIQFDTARKSPEVDSRRVRNALEGKTVIQEDDNAADAVLSKWLSRRLCTACRDPYPADETVRNELGLKLLEKARSHKAGGCEACGNSGYSGVVGILKLFLPGGELSEMIVAEKPVQALSPVAVREGMSFRKVNGVLEAMAGFCTLNEALNAL